MRFSVEIDMDSMLSSSVVVGKDGAVAEGGGIIRIPGVGR